MQPGIVSASLKEDICRYPQVWAVWLLGCLMSCDQMIFLPMLLRSVLGDDVATPPGLHEF